MDKKALVVAGGQWQVPLIMFLKSKGYWVTVVDPYDDSKGVLVADGHIKSDVREKEFVFSKIREKYDIVATDQSDVSVDTVAYLSEKMGLWGNQEAVVEKFSNKYLSRVYATNIGVSVPEFTEVANLEQLKEAVKKMTKPLIIKPCDAQSSKGIHVVNEHATEQELGMYLEDAMRYSFCKRVIVEQFVSGYEITVEGFCSDGKHQVMAISKKKHFKTGIASTLTYPADMPESIRKRVVECDNLYVEKSGLRFGPTHAEYIVDEKKDAFYLIEIACRGGGTLISSDIVRWVSGFDVYEAYLANLQGKTVDVKGYNPLNRCAELHFFDFGSGLVKNVSGVEESRLLEGVFALDIPIRVGDSIHTCSDDRSRQGFVIVFADTPGELQERIKKVCDTIVVEISHESHTDI